MKLEKQMWNVLKVLGHPEDFGEMEERRVLRNNVLDQGGNFNFGGIDIMESKFEEFNLLIKEHGDISGFDNVPDTIKRFILASETWRTHLQ